VAVLSAVWETPVSGEYRLLAIDDHPHSAELVTRIARQCGYDARGIVDTSSLADTLINWRPDVITLDLDMPRVDGSEIITVLKVVRFPGQVVIISGMRPELIKSARRQGVLAGLKVAADMPKPVDIKALRELLTGLHARIRATPIHRAG
jgi:two-component system, chemotaxis family, chemotaxis protein CheY